MKQTTATTATTAIELWCVLREFRPDRDVDGPATLCNEDNSVRVINNSPVDGEGGSGGWEETERETERLKD